MPTNITRTYSLIAVVLVLVLIFGGYYVMTNMWPSYQVSQSQYTQLQKDNADLQQALQSVSTFLDNYEKEEKNAAVANLALPKYQVDMANFLNSLDQVATQSGVVLSNLQIGTDEAGSFGAAPNAIQTQEISFGASGSYVTLKEFISRLETHLRLVDIYELTLSSADSETGTPILEYQIKLRTYYQQ